MKRIIRNIVITVALLAAAAAAYAAAPSAQAFIEPGYAVGYFTSYYTYRINADSSDFINEARIVLPPGVSGVSGISTGMASGSAALLGNEIVVTYGVPWNAFSNPNFDVVSFYAVSDAGDKYYGCYFNATPDAEGVTPNGFSRFVNIRTSTPTSSVTPTITPSHTVSETAIGTFTITETHSATPSITMTTSKTGTPNWTATPTFTITITYTGTPPTSTNTPSITRTSSRTATPSRTVTATPTFTRTVTPTRTSTVTPTATVTVTIAITGFDVSVSDISGGTAATGQPAAPVTRFGFTNIGGSPQNVSGLAVTLETSYAAPLLMSSVMTNLYLVDRFGNTVASSAAPASSYLSLAFSPVLAVNLQTTEYLDLYCDMKATTFASSFTAGAAAAGDVTCSVAVNPQAPYSFPLFPQPVNLKRRTTNLVSSYYDLMPPSVSTGQKNVYAFMMSLENTGGADYSAALLNYLTITVKDSLSNNVPADSAVSRIEIRDSNRTYFSSSAIPSTASMLCALAEPVTVEAAAVKNIYFIADITAGGAGTAGSFMISVEAPADLKMSEYHYGLPVACGAKTGFTFPQGSSSALIQNKAAELGVEYTNSMPLNVSTGQRNVEAMKLVLTNKGNTSTSSAMVTRMTFYMNDASDANLAAGNVIDSIKVTSQDGTTVYGQLVSFTGAKMTVNFTSPVVVSSASPVTVSVKLGINPAYYAAAFKLNLNSSDDVYAVDANIFEAIPVTSAASFPKRSGAAMMQQRALSAGLAGFTSLLPPAVMKGQLNVPVFSFGITNSNGALSAAEEFYKLTLSVTNQAGSGIAAGTAINGIYLVDSTGITRAAAAAGFLPAVALNVSPAVAVNQGTTVLFTLYADVPVSASAPDFSVAITSTAGIEIRDVNSKDECVKSALPLLPWQTSAASIYSSPATDVQVSGDGNIAPSMAGKGQPDVRMMIFDFYNPGVLGTADVAVSGITVTVHDTLGAMIAPASALSGGRIINASTLAVCGFVDLTAASAAAPFFIPAAGLYAPYSNTVSAYIAVDVGLNPSAVNYMLRVSTEQNVSAGSRPTGAIVKSPALGAVFPVDSKITTISSFALGFNVGHTALMPVSAAQGQAGVTAMAVLFDNANTAPISVTSVAVSIKDINGALINADAVAAVFYALDMAGNTVASSTAPASGNVVLNPAGYTVAGNSTGYLTIVLDVSLSAQGLFYMELENAAGIGTLPVASVNPMPGENFGGMESGTLSVQVPDFEQSAHVFPNPVDPALQPVSIEYYLPSASRVAIRIFTITGKPVAEITAGALKQPGLHSEDLWDAANSAGREVRSGVYIVIIEAAPVSGGAVLTAKKKLVVLR